MKQSGTHGKINTDICSAFNLLGALKEMDACFLVVLVKRWTFSADVGFTQSCFPNMLGLVCSLLKSSVAVGSSASVKIVCLPLRLAGHHVSPW